MENVTYLFGAGASANAIPTVRYFNARLEMLIKLFDSLKYPNIDTITGLDYEHLEVVNDKLKTIYNNIKSHYSIDTFAKKLYLKDSSNPDYLDLKHIINFVIALEQINDKNKLFHRISHKNYKVLDHLTQNEKDTLISLNKYYLDHRYDVFLSSIFKDKLIWPENIKVLTYNYDNQFEKAYGYYADYYSAYKDLKIYLPKYTKTPNIIKLNGFSIINKLTLSSNNVDFNSSINDNTPTDTVIFAQLVNNLYDKFFTHEDENQPCLINFAWETSNPYITGYSKLVENIIKETEHLVINGYSFPEFNRESDVKILQNLRDNINVHIQTLPETFEAISARFKQRAPQHQKYKIERVLFIDQFFIP
ncbi:MAG: hypothetical protein V9E90_02265 [Saprospiraceae bacterium]